MCLLGIDGMAFLKAEPAEALVYFSMLQEAQKLDQIRQKNLAILITNFMSRLFKK
jgi:hypothetical protein